MSKKSAWLYRGIKGLVRLFYPKIQVEGLENLPKESAVIVANHCQMNGPIACELYFPGKRYTWCAGQMMHLREVPDYAFQDFWSAKPRYSRWLYRILSYLIAPLSVCVFNNANTVGVYRDARIISTFKKTVERLCEGAHVVIFPEHDAPHNHIVNDFQDKFVDIARLYHKRTGKSLQFVPMYIAPDLRKMCLGEPVIYCPTEPADAQRQRLCSYLMDAITKIACSLPAHTVVPYRKTEGAAYPSNRKEVAHEKTGS